MYVYAFIGAVDTTYTLSFVPANTAFIILAPVLMPYNNIFSYTVGIVLVGLNTYKLYPELLEVLVIV